MERIASHNGTTIDEFYLIKNKVYLKKILDIDYN